MSQYFLSDPSRSGGIINLLFINKLMILLIYDFFFHDFVNIIYKFVNGFINIKNINWKKWIVEGFFLIWTLDGLVRFFLPPPLICLVPVVKVQHKNSVGSLTPGIKIEVWRYLKKIYFMFQIFYLFAFSAENLSITGNVYHPQLVQTFYSQMIFIGSTINFFIHINKIIF